MRKKMCFKFLAFTFLFAASLCAKENAIYWQEGENGVSFGQYLSKVVIEKILNKPVSHRALNSKFKLLISGGSILHHAKEGDVIWGSGFRTNPLNEKRFRHLDVRAVRGPKTRDFLLKMGIDCPEVYGDPTILTAELFPEFKTEKQEQEYIIIPNFNEIHNFMGYKNVVLPTLPWDEVIKKILGAKLVISSSLHGIIVAESYGIPARMLKMTWVEPLLKYNDYYESTGRTNVEYATSVKQALEMGGVEPGYIDTEKFLKAFPWDYFR